jgi:subtilisin family serine protease
MEAPSMTRRLPTLAALLFLALPSHARFCHLSEGETVRRIISCKEKVTLEECRRLAEDEGCAVVRELELIHALVVEFPERSVDASEERLRRNEKVDRVEPDRKVKWIKTAPSLEDAQAAASSLVGALRSVPRSVAPAPKVEDPEKPWGIKRVNAAGAWGRTQGAGVNVAVIDTGIDRKHPDVAPNLAGGVNIAEPGKDFQDDQGHGTHVAGTIAAIRDGQGVVGVAPKARLYAVKVLDSEGNGNYSDIIAGIQWCAKNGIQVANMSLGADEGNEALKRAVTAAAKKGLVIVAAAGNNDGGPVGYPAAYPEVIAVSASDEGDAFASFSSKGPQVDFVAPGAAIKSDKLGGGTIEHDGTSMASPHVAGLAALAVSLGARGPAGVKAALEAAATRLPGFKEGEQGAGMIDAARLRDANVAVAGLR